MKKRRAGALVWFVGAAVVTCVAGLGARSWAATRFFQYYTCNFAAAPGLLPQSSGLMTVDVNPATGALVHCPIVSDDAIPHAGPKAVITVYGKESSTTTGVSAVACVTFASTSGFFCTKPKTSGNAFVGDFTIVFTGPFAAKYAQDFPFVDVTLTMLNEGETSTLRGLTLAGP